MQKKILLFIGILAILLININNLLAENISIIPLKKPNLTLEEIEEKISKNILKPLKKPKKIKDLKKIEKKIDLNALKTLDPFVSVNKKTSFGGTSPRLVKKAISDAKKRFL